MDAVAGVKDAEEAFDRIAATVELTATITAAAAESTQVMGLDAEALGFDSAAPTSLEAIGFGARAEFLR